MALIELVLMAVWTALVLRLFCARATLGDRTFLTFMGLGALMAVTAAPLAEKFLVPYPLGDYNLPFAGEFLKVMVRNLVLLAPVVSYLFLTRSFRLTSVADAFLLAFSIAFGFELVGTVLAASVPDAVLGGFALLPPWQFTWTGDNRTTIFGIRGEFAVAGAGYGSALIALALACALRFHRRLRVAIAVTATVFILVTAYQALWILQLNTVGRYLPTTGLFHWFDIVMLHGKFMAVGAFTALVAAGVLEARWLVRSQGETPLPVVETALARINAATLRLNILLREGRGPCARLAEIARLKAQIAYAEAEMQLSVRRNELFERAQLLQLKLAGLQSGAAQAPSPKPPRRLWLDVWLAMGATVLVLVVLPHLPTNAQPWIWKFPLLNFDLPVVGMTLIQAVLVIVLLTWFVLRPIPAASRRDPDTKLQFSGESALSFAAMGAALLVLFGVPLTNFYPPFSTVAFLSRAPAPQFGLAQVATMILLFAAMADGVVRGPTLAWRAGATAQQLRAGIVKNALLIVNAAVLLWLSVKVYVSLLAYLQQQLGASLFPLFGQLGNVVVAVITAVLLFVISIGVGLIMRRATQTLEQFLIGAVNP